MEKRANILIVDDSETNREILCELITHIGHKAIEAENGQSALAQIHEQQTDIVLLDILMPEMSGYEVLEQIKDNKNLAHIPVIMISALDEVESVIQCIEKGADDYFVKPFNQMLLKTRINACLDKKYLLEHDRQLHKDLKEKHKALQNAEQNRDALVHMVVHDLNAPLSILLGLAEMLQLKMNKGNIDKEGFLKTLKKIHGSAIEMSSLIENMLDVSRLESEEMPISLITLNVIPVVRELCERYDSFAKTSRISLSFESKFAEIKARVDIALLNRILTNLISNALKYTEKGTKVLVTAEQEGSNVVISVTDKGQGIPKKFKDKIFDKFFQIKDNKKMCGVGIGLAFCKMAVEAIGGKICVESEEGKGASFKVSLEAL